MYLFGEIKVIFKYALFSRDLLWHELYLLVFLQEPFYKGELITFDVVPEKLPFQVAHSSQKLSKHFQVAGFSVSGQVLDSAKVNRSPV